MAAETGLVLTKGRITPRLYVYKIVWISVEASPEIDFEETLGGTDVRIFSVVTIPDAVDTPTTGYDVDLWDQGEYDVFGGKVTGCSDTDTERWDVYEGSDGQEWPPLLNVADGYGSLKLADTGGAADPNEVSGTILIYTSK